MPETRLNSFKDFLDTHIFDKLVKESPTGKQVIDEHPSLGKDLNNTYTVQSSEANNGLEESSPE